ncbi:MAG: acetyl-CoA carboxylase biotin carboxylase subunit [Coriobacteriia bacterium]|jgi:acetyl-CoA carboxylase biotin carboxylase subunit|nr:acetyl-CoA carboxylase biotin carboxylase subunit [Coriobacteriia bacterium]MDR2714545.1 acetyl-CoA carboxylase biotin carboxylase subunit [Coriobacteriales bacterium]
MFDKILIANRGEIAVRIIRAARELGVKTVAVYSEADRDTLAVKLADETVCIGPAPSAQSYLNFSAVIGAAVSRGAQAIHPGYGFMAERADFVRAVKDNDLVWIGPSAEAIELMGDKSTARDTMKRIGVPTVPGSDGAIETVADAARFADEVGYPVLIKASAGGGGKGMRAVENADELESAFTQAKTEAGAAFGNDEVYLEKLVSQPRHIEIQILADSHGNALHLCERDCSIQRRHQKLLEEAPSPALTPELREKMGAAALLAVREVGYQNAGTIEFLLDKNGDFYFMEMNTRVQVEHPVTEQITSTDIIKEQLRIAAGEPISFAERTPFTPRGHSIEFRINAEDPDNNFWPSPGMITRLRFPGGPGVRVDSHVFEGYTVPPTYDSLIAKLIVTGATREEAIARGKRALEELVIEGIKTTTSFHRALLDIPAFVAGDVQTDFIEKHVS